jgi:hypothetical protein
MVSKWNSECYYYCLLFIILIYIHIYSEMETNTLEVLQVKCQMVERSTYGWIKAVVVDAIIHLIIYGVKLFNSFWWLRRMEADLNL